MTTSRDPSMNRRNFLKTCAKTSLLGSGAYASLSSLTMMNALAQNGANDYKALVCVFLLGGNDSYNMFVPANGQAYNEYATARTNLAIPQNEILRLNSTNMGSDVGLHPAMTDVQALFNAGKCSIVANVGSLVEPTNRETYLNKSAIRPPKLFSHNDQQDYWHSMSAKEVASVPKGWAGRMADMMYEANGSAALPMNISLSGSNLWQSGDYGLPYNLSPYGVKLFNGFNRNNTNSMEQARIAAFDKIMAMPQDTIFAEQYGASARRTESLANTLKTSLDSVPEFATVFPNTDIGRKLKSVATTLAAKDTLGMSRQIFFVGIGGWDTHAGQLANHSRLLGEVSQGFKAFSDATEELGLANNVTTFTGSDFGRTLGSNGDGTDHGWGSHQIVMGGAVRGQTIYGEIPPLVIDGPQDSGRGRIIPTLSTEQYAATIARWYGLSAAQIAEVFPNLANFNESDLGFMS